MENEDPEEIRFNLSLLAIKISENNIDEKPGDYKIRRYDRLEIDSY